MPLGAHGIQRVRTVTLSSLLAISLRSSGRLNGRLERLKMNLIER